MTKLMERIKDVDLYLLLDILPDADEKAVKKAYRKKALSCHPDKNPDNPKAAEEFHLLSDAYEVLADPSAKKAYDNLLRARKANELRNRQLDAKRRKLKDDLEAREKAAKDESSFSHVLKRKTDEERLAEEIGRLRKEGSRQLEREQELMRQEIENERRRMKIPQTSQQSCPASSSGAKLKVRWREASSDSRTYDEGKLRTIFSKHGDVTEVVILGGKKGRMSGLVEMTPASAAVNAAKFETGFLECPLKVKLLKSDGSECELSDLSSSNCATGGGGTGFGSATVFASSLVTDNDFESLVMQKLRQEEARKREIQRILEEDAREAEEAAATVPTAKK